jgi:pyruvate kinase
MNASLRSHKTKIVATIGPASESPEMLTRLIQAGVSVARLNFSHGSLDNHGAVIKRIRAAAETVGQRVAIMADLPGPKLRIGKLRLPLRPSRRWLRRAIAFFLTTGSSS